MDSLDRSGVFSAALSLGVSDDATTPRLARVVQRFETCFPAAAIVMVEAPSATLTAALRTGEIDLALLAAPPPEVAAGLAADLLWEPLWQEAWLAVLPASHPLAAEQGISCAQLAGHCVILAQAELSPCGQDGIRAGLRSAGVVPRLVHQAIARSTMINLAASGVGIAFIPASLPLPTVPGIVVRPFAGARMTVSAAYRLDDMPDLARRFLRVARMAIGADLDS